MVLRSSEIQKLFVFLGSDDLWPILLILSAVPGLIVSFFFPCVPESPRYLLIIKKDKERAEKGISNEDGKKVFFLYVIFWLCIRSKTRKTVDILQRIYYQQAVSRCVQSKKRHRRCKLSILPACCNLSTSYNKNSQFHQVVTSLLKSALLQLVSCRLVTTCSNNL